jgi:Zn-dependent protease
MPPVLEGLLYYAVFLFSTCLHEAAHAWAAKRGGDPTAYLGGQVSLNPLPHMRREPIGMVFLPIMTALTSGWPLGFASAPYNREWALRYPRRAAWMALAGPAANLLLVLAAALLMRVGLENGLFAVPAEVRFGSLVSGAAGLADSVAIFLSMFFSMNLLLFVLNMIPLPPMDGAGSVPLLLTPEHGRAYRSFLFSLPMLSWAGMFAAWKLFDIVFRPVFWWATDMLFFTA